MSFQSKRISFSLCTYLYCPSSKLRETPFQRSETKAGTTPGSEFFRCQEPGMTSHPQHTLRTGALPHVQKTKPEATARITAYREQAESNSSKRSQRSETQTWAKPPAGRPIHRSTEHRTKLRSTNISQKPRQRGVLFESSRQHIEQNRIGRNTPENGHQSEAQKTNSDTIAMGAGTNTFDHHSQVPHVNPRFTLSTLATRKRLSRSGHLNQNGYGGGGGGSDDSGHGVSIQARAYVQLIKNC